jgi:hypothetical protein
MNAEEKAELDALCKQIVSERDQHRFLSLVMELNQLLERKNQRLQGDPNSQQGRAPD